MHLRLIIKKTYVLFFIIFFACFATAFATETKKNESYTIDRIQLVNEQIKLLNNRLTQAQHELTDLQKQHDTDISQSMLDKASKNLVDKAGLDISVSKSNLDSVSIELTDTRQTINWLEKNIQEIENQLNVLNVFGAKVATDVVTNVQRLRNDLSYQRKLIELEKKRQVLLEELQSVTTNSLQLRKENFSRLNAMLKSRKILHMKQQQIKDELVFQQQQNHWLHEVNKYYDEMAKVDPTIAKETYSNLEKQIFYANENANLAYTQSLIARYKDQIQQMKFAVTKNASINLLSEMSNQLQLLAKQIEKLSAVLKTRISVVDKHIGYMQKKQKSDVISNYLDQLTEIKSQYQTANDTLLKINTTLAAFRISLDQALQHELSSRQGFPMFDFKGFLDLGKETFLLPKLTYQVVKNLYVNVENAFETTDSLGWPILALMEFIFLFSLIVIYRLLQHLINKPSQWREKINSKWLSLQWFNRNFVDIAVLSNIFGIFLYFNIPTTNFSFMIYLAGVWLVCKTILTLAHICLMETTHETDGHDVKLYRILKWLSIMGGTIIAITGFVNQLPLIYEIKTLCDRLLLLFLMGFSLLLLRSWHVIPNLMLSHMESRHPYVKRSVRMIGFLIPLLLFSNSLIGLAGFMNLVITIAWYEGVFLLVLVGYLIVRGLMSDGMEQVSKLVIQYVHNGWLWTEAFLKPLDRVLRITLFLTAWAILFLLYGWDQQSPIVERLTRLLHYQLVNVLSTNITPLSMIEVCVLISVFYWTAKWTREFMYRLLFSRTADMGIRNSIAILSQYSVIVIGIFICLHVLGINLSALTMVASMFAFGIGLGLRDLANNFACGFLILLERPLRVGDIVSINGVDGEVTHIGGRAVTVRTWDYMELVVPNTEIFNKSFTNWTAKDNTVRTIVPLQISRHDNPHAVTKLIHGVLTSHHDVLKDPSPEVFLREIKDSVMDFELRYFVNIRQVKSRVGVASSVLLAIWDVFAQHDIKPPYPQHEIYLRHESLVPLLTHRSEMKANN